MCGTWPTWKLLNNINNLVVFYLTSLSSSPSTTPATTTKKLRVNKTNYKILRAAQFNGMTISCKQELL